MKLFGGNFSKGFITGLAESVDKQLKDDMDRTFERADRAADYHIRRAAAEQERYDAEMRDVEGLLKSFAGLVGGDLDKAAQLYNAGGGTVERASVFYDTLLDAKKKMPDFDINTAIPFAESQAGEFGMADYLGNLVNRPAAFAASQLPDSTTGGVGLFRMFEPGAAISRDISEQVSQAIPTTSRDFKEMDIATPTVDYSKMPEAMLFAKEQTKTDLAIETARANLSKINREAGLVDALSFSEYRTHIADNTRDIMQPYGIPVDENGNFDIASAEDKVEELSNTWSRIIQSSAETGIGATNTLTIKGNMEYLLRKASVKDKGGNYLVNVMEYNEGDSPQAGVVYGLTSNTTGNQVPHIYLGADLGFIPLY
jgi:hypothetical protein